MTKDNPIPQGPQYSPGFHQNFVNTEGEHDNMDGTESVGTTEVPQEVEKFAGEHGCYAQGDQGDECDCGGNVGPYEPEKGY